MTSYSGYIVASPAAYDFADASELEQPSPEAVRGPTLTHVRERVFNVHRWDEYLLETTTPLSDEPQGQDSYRYQVFAVRGFAKLILLAHRRRIIDFVIAQIFDRHIFPNLRKVSIIVAPMIEFCRQSDAKFLVTSLHGRYAGSATPLRSISLYGDEVTASPLYAQHHKLFNFHSAGLGHRLFEGLPRVRAGEDGEIVRLASDGFVNINLATRQRANELLEVVNFVMANRWVEEWVPVGKGGTPWPTT